jgi:aminoglycoside phosphotransferase (APT) family kinase protein
VTADIAILAQLLREIDPTLRPVRAWNLTGGVSAVVTAVMAASSDGSTQTLVVRQYGAANLRADPLVASHEFALLNLLHAVGLPVPRAYYADESSTVMPGPCLVIDFIDGESVTDPSQVSQPLTEITDQLAVALARLHKAAFTLAEAPYLADIADIAARKLAAWPTAPDESLSESAVRRALARIWPPTLVNQPVLLHGDYWPGNTLWRDGTLVGVVDWEDAVLGDPLADVGNARMEICMLFGKAAASDFTHAYRALMPDLDMTALPHWDLYGSLRHAGRMDDWGLEPADLARLQAGHQVFTAAALGQLAEPGATRPLS